MKNRDVQLRLEVSVHPKVVVADKIVDRDSVVSQFSQLTERAGKTPGNHGVIFKPEIE